MIWSTWLVSLYFCSHRHASLTSPLARVNFDVEVCGSSQQPSLMICIQWLLQHTHTGLIIGSEWTQKIVWSSSWNTLHTLLSFGSHITVHLYISECCIYDSLKEMRLPSVSTKQAAYGGWCRLVHFFFFPSPQFGNSANITEHMLVAINSAVRDGSDLLSMTVLTCTAMECQFTYSIQFL